MTPPPVGPTPKVNLLEALEDLEDQIPLTAEERAQLRREIPYDVAAGKREALGMVRQARMKQQRAELQAARTARIAAGQQLQRPVARRPRQENLALIQALLERLPLQSQPVAYFRDYESSPDEDLDLLLEELQWLSKPR